MTTAVQANDETFKFSKLRKIQCACRRGYIINRLKLHRNPRQVSDGKNGSLPRDRAMADGHSRNGRL